MDLAEIVSDVVELYQPIAEDKGQVIETTVSAGQNILANRHLLSQALANLLDNAIKYTPEGGAIAIALDEGPAITIADSGPGIPADDQKRVLERFVRLDKTRTTPGSGLGLSLVNAVARLHDAELTLEDNAPGLRVKLKFQGPPRRRNEIGEGERATVPPAPSTASLMDQASNSSSAHDARAQ